MRRARTGGGSPFIEGVALHSLAMHPDDRGIFTEIFRDEWETAVRPIQWNCVRSHANVLRGVHVHVRHSDYLVLVQGRATIGLRDLRPESSTNGVTGMVTMLGEELAGLVIPPGVAHGFYFHEPSMHIYSVSHYWDLADELGCLWNDPQLGLHWPTAEPHISERDAALPSLSELLLTLAHRRRSETDATAPVS